MTDRRTTTAVVFAAAMVAVLAIAWTRLFDPFSGDQALFFIGAKVLHRGGVLYTDYWDIKQPAIFVFFLLSCMAFGFDQMSPHVLDLVWQAGFSVALIAGLRGSLRDSRWAAFAPIAVVGATYAVSSAWHLLQVEELVGAPLFVCAWTALLAVRNPSLTRRLTILSGTLAGVVLLFKFTLAPVVVAVVVAVVARPIVARSRADRGSFALLWLAGLGVPLGCFAIYAAVTGSLPIALFTTFVAPIEIANVVPHAPFDRLSDSALRFVLYFRGIIVLAIVGAISARRPTQLVWRDAALTWIVAGAIVIVGQVDSWWQYQFLLLVPPVGILATFGAAFLGERVSRGGRSMLFALAGAGVISYIAVPLPAGAIATLLRVVRERPFESAASLERYRIATSTEYARVIADTNLRVSTVGPGSTYVFGNPLLYVVTNRIQGIAVTDWASYLDPPVIRRMLDREFTRGLPVLVFVSRERQSDVLPAKAPGISLALAREYVPLAQMPDGAWFVRRSSHR